MGMFKVDKISQGLIFQSEESISATCPVPFPILYTTEIKTPKVKKVSHMLKVYAFQTECAPGQLTVLRVPKNYFIYRSAPSYR